MLTLSSAEAAQVVDALDESGVSLPAQLEETYHQLCAGDTSLTPDGAWDLLQVLDDIDLPAEVEDTYHQVAAAAVDPATIRPAVPAPRWDLKLYQRTVNGSWTLSVDTAAVGIAPDRAAAHLEATFGFSSRVSNGRVVTDMSSSSNALDAVRALRELLG